MLLKDKIEPGIAWFRHKNWSVLPFQEVTWKAYLQGYNGIVNAPTGSGKTFSIFIPILLEALASKNQSSGLKCIWITPIRALAKEIESSASKAIAGLGLSWRVEIRHGDTSAAQKAKQRKSMPDVLVTTPESLHLMLAQKNFREVIKHLNCVVVDEWHELLGSKRGVVVELCLARLRYKLPKLKVWGISATIGNLDEALDILIPKHPKKKIIRAKIKKQIQVESVLPETIEKFPWAGHLGISLLDEVVSLIKTSRSCLIFTNTRAQAEIWYQRILDKEPAFSGILAMHHGSLDKELRSWVEAALFDGRLKAVVCTSSLDLGVDFRPVDTIIQIGSPKGVARFMQRAGRSGHSPEAVSKIYFVPTHSLELLEGAALREATKAEKIESRLPYIRSFDVLLQFMVSAAISGGFKEKDFFDEITSTFSFQSISHKEWKWCLDFLQFGGKSLHAYDEYQKLSCENDFYFIDSKAIAYRHRISMGTIVSDASLQIKFVGGSRIGTIEEWFISKLKPGDVFWFAGRNLELVRVKDMTVQVRKSKQKTGLIPSWMGGRMPLSSELGEMLRKKLTQANSGKRLYDAELKALKPLFEEQKKRSLLPNESELLIEYFKSKEGYHLFAYPFEGRFVHEGMATLIAHRISKTIPISFSIAMNDYGFELLSDVEIPIENVLNKNLFTSENLSQDIRECINSTEMTKRKFRDIACISGLVFQGYPNGKKKDRHLQSSSQLFFNVFSEYEPENLLLQQAMEEVMTFQLEESRMRAALDRINSQEIKLCFPEKATPFSFPILVDRLREHLSSEKLEDRVNKMKALLEK